MIFLYIYISYERKWRVHQDRHFYQQKSRKTPGFVGQDAQKKKHVGWTNIGDVGWKTVGFIHKHGEVLDFRSTNMCQLNY